MMELCINLIKSLLFTVKGMVQKDNLGSSELKQISMKDEGEITSFLKKTQSRSFWACFPTIYCFLNAAPRKTYFLRNKLICGREWSWGLDFRILYKKEEKDEEIIEKLMKQEPAHIGYSFMHEIAFENKKSVSMPEFEYDLKKICEMEGSDFKNLRNSYKYVKKKYPEISVKPLDAFSSDELIDFFNQWKLEKATKEAHITSDNILVNSFSNKQIFGTVVEINNKINGIEISCQHPHDRNYCVNVIRKTLPSFKQGGEFLQVEHAKQCIDKGYLTANDGTKGPIAQMKFKEKLSGNALPLVPSYTQTVYFKEQPNSPKDIFFKYAFATAGEE